MPEYLMGNAYMETTHLKRGFPIENMSTAVILLNRVTQSYLFLVIVYLHECVLNVRISVSVGSKNFPKDYSVLDVCSNNNKIA